MSNKGWRKPKKRICINCKLYEGMKSKNDYPGWCIAYSCETPSNGPACKMYDEIC